MVLAMIFLDPSVFHLLIIGGGDIIHKLEKIIEYNQLSEKITLIQKMPFAVLSHFTRKANLESPSINLPFPITNTACPINFLNICIQEYPCCPAGWNRTGAPHQPI